MFKATALNATAMKFVVAATLAIGLGAMIAFNPFGFEASANTAAENAPKVAAFQTVPTDEQSYVLAQITPPTKTTVDPSVQDAVGQNTDASNESVESWTRPDGEAPAWLSTGAERCAAVDEYRKNLHKKIEIDFNGTPLRRALASLADEYHFAFYINRTELDALGADVDSPITVSLPATSLRAALNLILRPLDLTYRVHESFIEITSHDNADEEPVTRYYDLTQVMPNASYISGVMMSIEQTCSPDIWLSAGGRGVCLPVASMLIVSCPEETHFQIEGLLANIAKIPRRNFANSLNPWPYDHSTEMNSFQQTVPPPAPSTPQSVPKP